MCKERMKNGHIMPTQRVFEEVEQFYMDNFMSSDINVSCKIGDRLFCMFCFSKKNTTSH